MRSCSAVFASLLSLFVFAGCGVRTGLNLGFDAGEAGVRPDTGTRDTRPPFDGGSCRTSSDCDDGQACNGFEECRGGSCFSGPSMDCNDFIDCTVDQCVEGAGCIARPNDMLCGPGFRCDMFRGCVPFMTGCREDFECDDGRFCNGSEICDRSSGMCIAGGPPSCDDGVGCTDDACAEGFGCVSEANPDRCMPPSICDRFSGCVVRSCMGPGDCDDGDLCNGSERCGADGVCVPGTRLDCNDGNDCTVDRCVAFMGCVSFAEAEVCGDGVDNDCNGLVDCGDFSCAGRPECGCVPTSRFEIACTDGRDDDCDGAPDCMDRDCAGRPECGTCAPSEFDCLNGRDDDCDGLVDCGDFDCSGRPECGMCMPIADREINCLDMRDDDCDGRFDCSDPDCAGSMECGVCASFEFDCFNGRDDDCNGLFDCEDPACAMRPGCGCSPTSMTELRCRDGIDDDCDGNIDCADFDCRTRPVCSLDSGILRDSGPPLPDSGPLTDGGVRRELGVAACTNGLDDDRDGRVDCGDPDCTPFGAMGECCNNIDDNGDGNIDEFTCRCFDDSFCSTVGTLDQVCWLSTFSVCAPRCDFYGGDTFCMMILPTSPHCNRTTGECE
jgi:hypothetical protein